MFSFAIDVSLNEQQSLGGLKNGRAVGALGANMRVRVEHGMKATLEFDLEENTDVLRLQRCLQSEDLVMVIHDIFDLLRHRSKYQDHTHIAIDELRKEMLAMLEDRNIQMD